MSKLTMGIVIALTWGILLAGALLAVKAERIVRESENRPTVEKMIDNIYHNRPADSR